MVDVILVLPDPVVLGDTALVFLVGFELGENMKLVCGLSAHQMV